MGNISKYCVIDCRVSDEAQLKGGSLEDQEAIGLRVASQLGLEIAKVFKKSHSATTTEREDFKEVIDFIKNDERPITCYIIKSLDRLTREGYPEYLKLKKDLEAIGVELKDAQGVIQSQRNTLEHLGDFKYRWSVHSPSEASEMLEAYKGKAEVRDILTRLVGAEIRLVQEGYAVRRAPDGLRNKSIVVEGKKKVIREIDPERGHYFQTMFELLADGMGQTAVVRRLNSMGFKTKVSNRWDRTVKEHPKLVGSRGGNPLTVKQLQRYIRQTEYAGVSYEKWTKHRPTKLQQFNGIVSIETFNRANRGQIYIKENQDRSFGILHNYSPWGNAKRLKNNPKYLWKCILCPLCRSELLASSSRGKSGKKYDAYHCGRSPKGKRAHAFFRVPQNEFEQTITSYFDSLKFEGGFVSALELYLIDKYREREKEILVESTAIKITVTNLKIELARKLDAFAFAENPTVRRMLETQVADLDTQIRNAETERENIGITEKSIHTFCDYAKKTMEQPAEVLTGAANLRSRRALLSLFFEEVPTYENILNGTPKLSLLFRLSEDFKVDKSQLVNPLSLGWNTFAQILKQWMQVFANVDKDSRWEMEVKE